MLFIQKKDSNRLLLTCFISALIIKVSGLKCYICDSYNKEPCPEEDLKLCGTHQAFDRCLIRMVKSDNQPFKVIRECALAPCNFREKPFDSILKLQDCDLGRNSYDCVYCCKEDGCNKNIGHSLALHFIIFFLTLGSIILITNEYFGI